MKHEKEIEKVKVYKYTDFTTCDKCGQKVALETYDHFKCEITRETGSRTPEGDFISSEQIDLCQDCAEEIFNRLKKEGYKINLFDNCP
jgi:hypothetical protein